MGSAAPTEPTSPMVKSPNVRAETPNLKPGIIVAPSWDVEAVGQDRFEDVIIAGVQCQLKRRENARMKRFSWVL
jgi:hypothetical protein